MERRSGRRGLLAVRVLTFGAVAALLLATAVPAETDRLDWAPTPGGWAAGPVSYIDTVPFETGAAGGMDLRGDLLVATSWHSFSLYDVSDPTSPELLTLEPLGPHFISERPQLGDGWLAINSDFDAALSIWDVSDPENPEQIAEVAWQHTALTRRDHQWTCVNDCAYLYSNAGTIIDMADPADPQVIGDWYEVLPEPARDSHGINEVAPGIVLTGTLPVHLLDARDNPEEPTLVATEDVPTTSAESPYVVLGPPPESFAADLAWPLEGSGDFALISNETPFSGECTGESGEVLSVDMRAASDEDAPSMTTVDTFQITENGTPNDGLALANVIGCSPYVMGVHPGFDDTGWFATAFMEHGIRLLELDADGQMHEAGGFIPHLGASTVPLWVDDETLYVLDFVRGIDILRVGS